MIEKKRARAEGRREREVSPGEEGGGGGGGGSGTGPIPVVPFPSCLEWRLASVYIDSCACFPQVFESLYLWGQGTRQLRFPWNLAGVSST